MVEIHDFAIFVFLSSWELLSNFLEIQFRCVFVKPMIEINSLSMYKHYNTQKIQEKKRGLGLLERKPQELVGNNGIHSGSPIKLLRRSKQGSSS